jgi:hypothetical protein
MLPENARIVAVANGLVYESGLGEASSGVMPLYPLDTARSLGIGEEQMRGIEQELRQAVPRIEGMIGAIAED